MSTDVSVTDFVHHGTSHLLAGLAVDQEGMTKYTKVGHHFIEAGARCIEDETQLLEETPLLLRAATKCTRSGSRFPDVAITSLVAFPLSLRVDALDGRATRAVVEAEPLPVQAQRKSLKLPPTDTKPLVQSFESGTLFVMAHAHSFPSKAPPGGAHPCRSRRFCRGGCTAPTTNVRGLIRQVVGVG